MSENVTQQKQKRHCDINGDLFKEIIEHTYTFHSALTNEVASHSKLKSLNLEALNRRRTLDCSR